LPRKTATRSWRSSFRRRRRPRCEWQLCPELTSISTRPGAAPRPQQGTPHRTTPPRRPRTPGGLASGGGQPHSQSAWLTATARRRGLRNAVQAARTAVCRVIEILLDANADRSSRGWLWVTTPRRNVERRNAALSTRERTHVTVN
jgi:hypothetical protein